MMKRYDVVIVGGGLAGLSAAYEASVNGLKTLIIEKKPEIGHIYKSSGGIAHYFATLIESQFTKKSRPTNFIRQAIESNIRFAKIHAGDKELVIRPEEGCLGYVVDHREVEKKLAESAKSEGCEIHVGEKAVDFKVNKLYTSKNVYEYKSLIVADGCFGDISKKVVGIPKPEDIHLCIEYWVKAPGDETLHLFFKPYCPKGYIWVFPAKEYVKIGCGMPISEKPRLKKVLRKFVKEHPEFWGEIISVHGGSVPTAPPLPHVVHEDIALVGDAARTVNAATGGGIQFAMMSGAAAARAAWIGNLEWYDDWYRNLLYPKLKTWYRVKRILYRLTPKDLGYILGRFGDVYEVEPDINPTNEIVKILKNIILSPRIMLKIWKAVVRT